MSVYGKRAAWRGVGSSCLKYGVFGVFVSVVAGIVIGIQIPLMPWLFVSNIMMYSAVLALPVLGLMYLEQRRRDVRNFPFFWEAIVVSLVVLGLGVPVTILGALVLGATLPDYEGIERWLPDIEDRTVYELKSLQKIIADLELSEETHQSAELMLERARDKGLMKGRSFTQILGGIIYIVARDNHEPRTLDEIADTLRISNRELGNAYRYVGRELDEKIVPPPPEDYISWFAQKLDLDGPTTDKATDIVDEAVEQNIISGKSSTGIAAAALYIAAHITGEPRSLREVSEALDVTTVTIRQRGRELVEQLDIENPPETMETDRTA